MSVPKARQPHYHSSALTQACTSPYPLGAKSKAYTRSHLIEKLDAKTRHQQHHQTQQDRQVSRRLTLCSLAIPKFKPQAAKAVTVTHIRTLTYTYIKASWASRCRLNTRAHLSLHPAHAVTFGGVSVCASIFLYLFLPHTLLSPPCTHTHTHTHAHAHARAHAHTLSPCLLAPSNTSSPTPPPITCCHVV